MFYLDDGDMLAADPTIAATIETNSCFVARWKRSKQSKEIELFGRLHSDLWNVPRRLLPGVQIQVRLKKAKRSFNILAKAKDSKATLRFLYAQLFVSRVRSRHHRPFGIRERPARGMRGSLPSDAGRTQDLHVFEWFAIPVHRQRGLATPAEMSSLRHCQKRRVLGTVSTNPYNFRHNNLTHFVMYVNARQVPSEGAITLDMDHEKTSVIDYRTLFTGSGIHHPSAGLLITHDIYIAGYFMLFFDITTYLSASDAHTSLPENGAIRIELKFKEALKDPVTCHLYLEYDGYVRNDNVRTVTTDY
jgi:hypothetical protein